MTGVVEQVLALLRQDKNAAARALVDAACAQGDGAALGLRALWQVEGRLMPRALPAGDYDLKWHIVGADQHKMEGGYSFKVK